MKRNWIFAYLVVAGILLVFAIVLVLGVNYSVGVEDEDSGIGEGGSDYVLDEVDVEDGDVIDSLECVDDDGDCSVGCGVLNDSDCCEANDSCVGLTCVGESCNDSCGNVYDGSLECFDCEGVESVVLDLGNVGYQTLPGEDDYKSLYLFTDFDNTDCLKSPCDGYIKYISYAIDSAVLSGEVPATGEKSLVLRLVYFNCEIPDISRLFIPPGAVNTNIVVSLRQFEAGESLQLALRYQTPPLCTAYDNGETISWDSMTFIHDMDHDVYRYGRYINIEGNFPFSLDDSGWFYIKKLSNSAIYKIGTIVEVDLAKFVPWYNSVQDCTTPGTDKYCWDEGGNPRLRKGEVCSDSDGGSDYYVAGNLSVGNLEFSDGCLDNRTLLEYSCSVNNSVISEEVCCFEGCVGGVCV